MNPPPPYYTPPGSPPFSPYGNWPPPQAVPPRRSSWVLVTFFILSLIALIGSVGLNILLFIAVAAAGASGDSSKANVLVDGDASNRVASLQINGVISGATSVKFDKLLKQIEADSTIKAIVLEIDTPGGEVTASDEIYQRLKAYKTRSGAKVVVSMGSMATSGGYYIACAADHIFAQPTTLTGNIGVVLQRFNFSGLMEKYGVKETSITPAESRYKNVESPFKPETPEATAYLSGIADDIYARFKTIVKTSRGTKLTESVESVADGRAFTARVAKDKGLIDDIDYVSAAYIKAEQLAGITGAQVVRFERSPTFVELISGAESSSAMGKASRMSTGSSPGMGINIDRHLIDEATTPAIYVFVSR